METEQAYFKYEANEITNTWLLDIFGVKNNGEGVGLELSNLV